MSKLKASVLIVTRQLLKERGEKIENDFLQILNPEEYKIYKSSIPGAFLDVHLMAGLLQKAVTFIFPGHPAPFRELGRLEARQQLTGIYKVFLSITSLSVLVRTYPMIWKTYFDTGDVSLALHGKSAEFKLTGSPDFPRALAEKVGGFLVGTWELMGYKNIKIDIRSNDTWRLTWI